MKILHINFHTIRTKLLTMVISIFILITIFSFCNNLYSIEVVRNQVSQSNRNTMILQMRMLDFIFTNIEKFLVGMSSLDSDVKIIERGEISNELHLAKQNIGNKFKESTVLFSYIDALFLYSPMSDCYVESAGAYNEYIQKSHIQAFISEYLNGNDASINYENWFQVKINDQFYFFRIIKFNSTFVGAWVNINKLLLPLQTPEFGKMDHVFFATSDGEALIEPNWMTDKQINLNGSLESYYYTGEKNDYMVVGAQSAKGNFNLIALISEKNILEGLGIIQIFIRFIPFALLLIIPLVLAMLRKMIVVPISRIVKAMELMKKGDLDVQITHANSSDEFETVKETFNSMTREIKQLKIDIYEEKLMKQKSQLQYFQLQIQPHFFINCLNMIYNLAQVKDYKLVQELTMYLGNHFRYGLRSNSEMICLEDELQHINNYLKIQQLRFPYNLRIQNNVDDSLSDVLIPPLLIQTFIENAVKYALSMDVLVQISIEVHILPANDKMMEIVIYDTGPGFPDNVIYLLETGQRIGSGGDEHIGIYNIQQRLWLIYGKNSEIKISNIEPHGAKVNIIIPIDGRDLSEV